jgi:hypothetical protein
MQEDGEEEGDDGEEVDQVHRFRDKVQLSRGAREAQDVLEGEVDDAHCIDYIQDSEIQVLKAKFARKNVTY